MVHGSTTQGYAYGQDRRGDDIIQGRGDSDDMGLKDDTEG